MYLKSVAHVDRRMLVLQ